MRLVVHLDGRTATGSASVVSDEDVRALVDRVADAVRVAPLDPTWPGLAPSARAGSTSGVDLATAGATPADRAEVVRGFVDGAEGLETAGYCRTNHWTGGFANSAGQSVSGEAVECGVSGIARDRGADGLARYAPLSIAELDGAPSERARRRRRARRRSRSSCRRVATRWCSSPAPSPTCSATSPATRSPVGGQRAQVLPASSAPTSSTRRSRSWTTRWCWVWGTTPRARPGRRLSLVERGTDRRADPRPAYGCRGGSESTGHHDEACSPSAPWRGTSACCRTDPESAAAEVDGPAADSSVAALVAGVERGILVSDFWYTRVLDPRCLAITGLTRNGVWLIEDGEVTAPVKQLPVHPVLRAGAGPRQRARRGHVPRARSPATPTRPRRRAAPARPCTWPRGTSPAARRAERLSRVRGGFASCSRFGDRSDRRVHSRRAARDLGELVRDRVGVALAVAVLLGRGCRCAGCGSPSGRRCARPRCRRTAGLRRRHSARGRRPRPRPSRPRTPRAPAWSTGSRWCRRRRRSGRARRRARRSPRARRAARSCWTARRP